MGLDDDGSLCYSDAMVQQNVLATDWMCPGCIISVPQPSETWMIYRIYVINHRTKHGSYLGHHQLKKSGTWRSVGCWQTQLQFRVREIHHPFSPHAACGFLQHSAVHLAGHSGRPGRCIVDAGQKKRNGACVWRTSFHSKQCCNIKLASQHIEDH